MSDRIRLSVLGKFTAVLPDKQEAQFRTRRAAELIAKLSLASAKRALRSDIASDLWPGVDRSTGLRNLRPTLNYARTALGCPDSIIANDDWLILSDDIESDWQEIHRLESKVLQAKDGDDRLVLLYSLNEAIQKPLLGEWDVEWVEDLRTYHDQRRLNALRQLAEELGNRGEWRAALDYAMRIRTLAPTSEDGIRLVLKCLGELERPSEAQREFASYAKYLKASLELEVAPGLRQLAEQVVTGRYQQTGSRPLTSIQQEMISNILGMMVDEEPERLLPLLSSPKLNWSLVFYGSEMRPILERTLSATSGWSRERGGVAKRLLQVYSQEHRWPETARLANDLLQSEDPTDRLAALNFLSFERREALDYPKALELIDQAVTIAKSAGERYLRAVSATNRAVLNISFEMYKIGIDELRQVLDHLAERTEPNARFSTSIAKSWLIAAAIAKGDMSEADRYADEWRMFAETNGTLAFDSQGKLFYGMVHSASNKRSAQDWLLAGIDSAFQSREPNLLRESTFPVIYALRALGRDSDASFAAYELHRVVRKLGVNVLPFHQRLMGGHKAVPTGAERLDSVASVMVFCREKILSAA